MAESSTEERWCIRLKDNKACEGPRRRTTSCNQQQNFVEQSSSRRRFAVFQNDEFDN